MDFENLKQVMLEISEELSTASKQKLQSNGSVRTGKLLKSIKPQAKVTELKAGIEMVEYGKFVENGTKYQQSKPFIEPSLDMLNERFKDQIQQALALDIQMQLAPIINK
jgi:hypothetical protein